jgi:hypothetical protein
MIVDGSTLKRKSRITQITYYESSKMKTIKILDNEQYDDNGRVCIDEVIREGTANFDYYSGLEKVLESTDIMGWGDSIAIYKFEDDYNGWFYALTNWIEPSDLVQ